MTKKSLTDMLKEEVQKDPNDESEPKIVRRHTITKADLELEVTRLTEELALKEQELLAANTDRDQLRAAVTQLQTDREIQQSQIEQLQSYLAQATAEKAQATAEITVQQKPVDIPKSRIPQRPIGSNQDLTQVSNQSIGWFD